ncbi:hypothetical protein HA402_014650 [Bradysia odoriphaga]|nr:hypothetical protein HA402_014650 [Bradysia odoriphaga]
MFVLTIFLVVTAVSQCFSYEAKPCNPNDCRLPDCRCAGIDIPGNIPLHETPQFVTITFDDAVTFLNNDYYQKAFPDRVNPDSCPVAATYYISHEYTDYSLVHKLYRQGHEIALHSITHLSSTEYWKKLSVSGLADEFAGQKVLTSHFAKIPADDLQGIRMPFLQMSGDQGFEMLNKERISFDSSWPSQKAPGLWPYTLDTLSTQDCVIGPCPTNSWNGTWVQPMLSWKDPRNYYCSMVDMCLGLPEDVDGLVGFMIDNFNRNYLTNKAPFGFFVHSAWFIVGQNHFAAFVKFIDYLQGLPDVYLVGASDVLKWVKNPVSISKMKNPSWSNCRMPTAPDCVAKSCKLKKNGQERYMTHCQSKCPATYPWLGNPLGEVKYNL